MSCVGTAKAFGARSKDFKGSFRSLWNMREPLIMSSLDIFANTERPGILINKANARCLQVITTEINASLSNKRSQHVECLPYNKPSAHIPIGGRNS